MDDAESDRVKADVKLVDQLGEILVMVFGINWGKSRVPSNVGSAVKDPVREVAEKALKGKTLSHEVGQVQPLISKFELRLTSRLASGGKSCTTQFPAPGAKKSIQTAQTP